MNQHLQDILQFFAMSRNPEIVRTQHQQLMTFQEQIKQYPDLIQCLLSLLTNTEYQQFYINALLFLRQNIHRFLHRCIRTYRHYEGRIPLLHLYRTDDGRFVGRAGGRIPRSLPLWSLQQENDQGVRCGFFRVRCGA